MRPIKLKIKGLNSFIEEQTIDFDKLTDRGLFGIFGPTGSGKSTILDGITLALYGDVSRKSSNYINTNCDRLNVSFEFQISGSEIRRYLVTREFKRDKKSGNPVSGKCKIVDITNGEEVLADKVKTVTDKCKEVIGLSLEDFTRTVVLPQGKFSEFLKLEGKPRREMLERLFNLGQYGDNLSRKLSREITKEKTENSVLLGQLMGYEDISEEKKNEKAQELELSINNLKKANDELNNIEAIFNENQELWNLQLEVISYKDKEKELTQKETEIEDLKGKVRLGEAAFKVNPYIVAYDYTLKNIESTEKELSILTLKSKEFEEKKIKVEEEWNAARIRKDNELPIYKIKEERVRESLEDKKSLNILEDEIKDLKCKEEALLSKKKENEDKLIDSENRLKKGNSLVIDEEKRRDNLIVDSDLKSKVQQGVVITNDYEKYYKRVNEDKIKIEKLKEIVKKSLEEEALIKSKLDEKKKALVENKNILEELIKDCPGNQDDLLTLQGLCSDNKRKLEDFKKATEEILKYKKYIVKANEDLKENKDSSKNIAKEIESLKAETKAIEIENLAHNLRESLNYGDICPVCGSIEHHKENIKHVELKEVSELEKEIKIKEKSLKEIEINITKLETNIGLSNDRINENEDIIKNLGDDFNEEKVNSLEEKLESLKKKFSEYNTQKEKLETVIVNLNEECHNLDVKYKQLETAIESYIKQLSEIEDEYKDQLNEMKSIEEKLNNLKLETKVNDFILKNEEINKIEREREVIEVNIKRYRQRLEELNKIKEFALSELNVTNQEVVKVQSSLDEKLKFRHEKLNQIKNKVEDINNIEEVLSSIQKVIKEIEENFINLEKLKVEADNSSQECNNKIIALTSKNKELYKRKEIDKEKLDMALKEEGFIDINEVLQSIIDKNKIQELKLIIENYNSELSKVRGAIESLLKKINNRELTEERWIQIQKEKKDKEVQLEELSKVKIKIEEELKTIENKIIELKDLLKQKEKLDHKLALLNDLDKLFKGKKFVEFVAATRLKYVSIEASKRLKEITNGNYGLEVDEDGRFIIRDYKNGGAERDASTLSGGETFLASLALALALSAEIQLKGTAPLELFFLDEGFGTLDDNLLEVVMSSLERIHNDKLKVGIISHVESIKNRVPVKLLITPAEAGMGGSKVKIERS